MTLRRKETNCSGIGLLLSKKNHLPAKAHLLLQSIEVLLRNNCAQQRIQTKGIDEAKNAALPVGNDGEGLEDSESFAKQQLPKLPAGQLAGDMLGGLHGPANITQPIHHKLVTRGYDEITARVEEFRGPLDIAILVFHVRDDFGRDQDIEVTRGKSRVINAAGDVVDIRTTRLGGRNAFSRKVDPVSFSQFGKPFGKPALSTAKIQHARIRERKPADQRQHRLGTPFAPII